MKKKDWFLVNYLSFGLKFMLTSNQDEFGGEDFYDEEKFKKGAIWELCGYAPGDLNIYLGQGTFDGWLFRNGNTYCNFDGGLLPILKPLSDLVDNILDNNNDENYQLNCELADLLKSTNSDYFVKALISENYYAIDHRLWNDIEYFFYKNHFDWKLNLIKKGEAIDINYITK